MTKAVIARFQGSGALLLPVGLITLISLVTLFSIDLNRHNVRVTFSPWHQLLVVGMGIVVALVVRRLSLEVIYKYSLWLYAISVLLLVILLSVGEPINGAIRWFSIGSWQVQPSELAKLGLILLLARLLSRRSTQPARLSTVWLALAYTAVPMALIVMQPDLGTGVMLLIIWLIMLISARLPTKHMTIVGGGLGVITVIGSRLLADYQRSRLSSFLDPGMDPTGAGYNAQQALIAIGSGRLMGQGLDAGTQSQLNFLPAQHTDFIFAVIAEKLGFAGAGLVLLGFALLVVAIFQLARKAPTDFALLVVLGIGGMIIVQAAFNIAMNLGLAPVTGIPLPFASYGGSHTLTNFLALGILLSVARTPKSLKFDT